MCESNNSSALLCTGVSIFVMAQKYPFCPFWDQIFVKYGCAVSVCPSAGFCLDSLVREDKQAATEQEARAPLHLLSGHPVKLAGNGKCLWGCNPASICIYSPHCLQ